MLVLLLVIDVIIINYFLNQFLHFKKGIRLLSLYKSLNLAYISFKSRLINLLNVLFLSTQIIYI